MAAKGVGPTKPTEKVTVLYQLCFDPEDKIRAAAEQQVETFPRELLSGVLGGELDPRVIDFFASKLSGDPELLEVILLNHATADETVARCASTVDERLSEIVATNEQRLLRHPAIIENLYHNKRARMSTVNRAIELAARNHVAVEGIPAFKEALAAIQGELIVDEEGPTPMDEVFSTTLSEGEQLDEELGPEGEEKEHEEKEHASERRMSLQAQLGQMTASEKIRMALLGSASHRSILVRDNNRLVAMAAIKSPAIRDNEVLAYSRNKSLHEDVVRYIAERKEWTKNYKVKHNLVENPKTPLPKALSFLSHLRAHDLKNVARSKNIPAGVAQAARNQLKKRR
jgi:hypothetical protein